MFGMAELQQPIGGRSLTDDAIDAFAECYSLRDISAYLCKTSPTFLQTVDNDELTSNEAMDDEEENDALDEANALMMFEHGEDEDQSPQRILLPLNIGLLMH